MRPDHILGLNPQSVLPNPSGEIKTALWKEADGTSSASTEATIAEESTDRKVTLKTGDRVEPRRASVMVQAFEGLAENDPEHWGVLIGLINDQVATNPPQILEDLGVLGLVDSTGQLKPGVREVFHSSYQRASDGKVTFVSPFAPATQEERLTLLQLESARDQRMGKLFGAIWGDEGSSPPGRW